MGLCRGWSVMNCHVSNQIAINADEPEAPECECGAQMTLHDGDTELTCDKKCNLGELEDE